jgi:Proteasome subunit
MTSIVGVRCTDGVVVGADSSALFGDDRIRTIEQPTEKKIRIIGERVIVAGTGYVGHAQRFVAVVEHLWANGQFKDKSGIEVGKMLTQAGVNDFSHTMVGDHLRVIDYGALVAYPAMDRPCLCELPGRLGFQPELKEPDDLWFASTGSGQSITDPFLALFRSVFWKDGPPNIQGGIFTALWALMHACEVNPGGINEPIKIAVLSRTKGKLLARELDEAELREHRDMVAEATRHFAEFREILTGKKAASEVPKPS